MEKLEDILTRFGNKIANAGEQGKTAQAAKLLPDRHPVRDFFIADILDWALKDDRHSMEHPFFSLSKTPDIRTRRYQHNGVKVTVTANAEYGIATIWDKDILLYCISVLTEALNQGREINRTVRLTAYNLLVTTNRTTGGRAYDELKSALDRLRGTSITTNIVTNGSRKARGFGLIDNWEIVERSPTNGRMLAVEVTLNKWLYDAVLAREVLTLNRDYFRLSGGLERRLYELARKHCGHQGQWSIGLDLLHKKVGSTGPVWELRRKVKRIAGANALPHYRLRYEPETDSMWFHAKDS